MDPSNRQQLFMALNQARQELLRSMLFLSEKEAMDYAQVDNWCIRDVMSHITARECTALAAVQHLVEDGDPQFPDPLDDQQFNRSAVLRRRDLSLSDVLDELDGTRRLVLRYTRPMLNQDLYGVHTVRSTGEAKSIADVLAALVEHDYLHASQIWQRRIEMGMLHRLDFRTVLIDERTAFMNALGGMYEEEMISIPVCGHWTVKDLMAHMLSWDDEILRTMEHWTDERPWQQDALYDDEWNELEVYMRNEMTVIDLADALATSQRKILRAFDRTEDAKLVALALTPWGDRTSLLGFLYEMALHNGTHRADLEKISGPPAPRRRRKR